MRVIMFKDQFAQKVMFGEKCQTVRKSARCKVGDRLSFRRWTGKPYRSKQFLLTEATCTGVFKIHIGDDGVEIQNVPIMFPDRDDFARADGFTGFAQMADWFRDVHGLPFDGELITWSNHCADGRSKGAVS